VSVASACAELALELRPQPKLQVLSVRQIDGEIMRHPGGIACDCGFVPKIEMQTERSEQSSSAVCRRLGFLPRDEDLEVLGTMLCYVREFLAKTHPDVGRGGPVCPFIPKALKLDCLYLQVSRGRTRHEVRRAVEDAKAAFGGLKPNTGNMRFFRAVVLVFPEVPIKNANSIIDGTQQELKDRFVQDGLMLGEFHLLNNAPGLRNANFFPLRAPYPCLAMRHMVPSDLPFLKDKKEWTQAYLGQFDSAENFASAKADLKREAELAMCS